MLYLVGLGLADETDVTVKGLDAIKKAHRVYLEAYTSILLVKKAKLVRSRTYSQSKALREEALTSARPSSRKRSMGDPSLLRTVKWSNLRVMKF